MNLKEFSELLGLSPTTVSRALNGYPEVSEKTRQRVFVAAEKHHYRPSHHATKLAAGATHSIGHIAALGSQLIDSHYADFIAGAGEVYGKNGYDLSLAVVPPEKERETYIDYIRTKKVDGIMVQSPVPHDWRIALLRDSAMPFVVHGHSDGQIEDYGLVDVHNRQAFRRATNYLIDLGHQRIALINGEERLNFAKRRKEGYLEALTANGIAINPDWCSSNSMTEVHGYAATKYILALPKASRPTALIVSSSLPALGAHRAILEQRLRVPDDISIVAYDDCLSFLRDDSGTIPLFTCLRSSIFEHGKQAARQIITQINNPNQTPVQTIWDAELVIGRSTSRPIGQ